MKKPRAIVYDGAAVHELVYGESNAEFVRSLSLITLRRLAHGPCRALMVDPATIRALAVAELRRREPQHDRGREAADQARARRRWVTLLPVFTNYSNGGH